jgi:hypothetical protein
MLMYFVARMTIIGEQPVCIFSVVTPNNATGQSPHSKLLHWPSARQSREQVVTIFQVPRECSREAKMCARGIAR